MVSALSIDPIEKKPFYHYYPGSKIFSVGFWGCNMSCPFCQNWQISQNINISNQEIIPPESLLEKVQENALKLLAFTYNEPLIHYNYILKTAKKALDTPIKISLVSNGMLNKNPAKKLLPFIDAVNVDLKCFNEESYRKMGGDFKTVLTFIEEASSQCHVELTTLIVPGLNDREREMEKLADFVSKLPGKPPLHLSAYYPAYRYREPPTSTASLEKMLDIARQYLTWVYPGNSSLPGDSICPNCGSTLIQREGYHSDTGGLKKDACRGCGLKLPFITES